MKNDKRKICPGSGLLALAVLLIVFSFHANGAGLSQPSPLHSAWAEHTKASAGEVVIVLKTDNTIPGIVALSWTASPPGNYEFELIRTDQIPGSLPQKIYTGNALSYTDTITYPYCRTAAISGYSLSYKVQIKDNIAMVSNIATGVYWDDNLPVDPGIDTISIDLQGHPVISWVPGTSTDVAGYIIEQKYAGEVWKMVGFAPGNLSSFFTVDSIKACTVMKTFAAITRDRCNNKSNGFTVYPNALNTLLLAPPIEDGCGGPAVLTWNKYNNMKPAFGKYQVYRNENGGVFKLIGSVTGQDKTTFTDTWSFINGFTYGYKVRAISSDGKRSSTSCTTSFVSARPPRPDTLSLNYTTVKDSRYVELGIHFAPPETVRTIQVLRSEMENGPFDTIISIANKTQSDIVIDDTTAQVNQRSYYYKINALDQCELFARASDRARTIFLTCRTNSDASHTLTWNDYEGWRGGIGHYEVNRMVNDIADPANPIGLTEAASFTDLTAASEFGDNIVSYYVKAIEGNTAKPGQSVSNTVRTIREPQVLMPNAFVPRGVNNNRFRPVMDYFVGEGNYQLVIYNKWWQQVFVSTEKSLGWDGRFNGEYAPGGIYYYRLKYSSLTGDSFSKSGLLMLVE